MSGGVCISLPSTYECEAVNRNLFRRGRGVFLSSLQIQLRDLGEHRALLASLSGGTTFAATRHVLRALNTPKMRLRWTSYFC